MSGPAWRDVLEGSAAAVVAFLVMAAVSVLSLHLLGAGDVGSLGGMTAAVVALATGGSVTFGMDVGGGILPISAGLGGSLDMMPLGITTLGAITLSAGFLLPLRRRPALRASGLALRASSAAITWVVAIAVAAGLGHGTLSVGRGVADLLSGSGGVTGGLDLSSILSGGGDLTYDVNRTASLLRGLLFVLVLLALCWLAGRRTPLPVQWAWVGRLVRPVVSAAAAITVVITFLGVLVAVVFAVAASNGDRIAGGLLLALPNLVVVLLTVGIGVPWRIDAGGAIGEWILSRLRERFPAGTGGQWSLSLGSLADLHRPVWVLSVALTGLVLLSLGVLAAKRAPRGADGQPAQSVLGRGLRQAASLGIFLALVLPLLTILAGASATLGINVFGLSVNGATLDLSGSAWLALAYGLPAGAVAGFLGSVLVDLVRAVRRSGPPGGAAPSLDSSTTR